MINNTAFFKEHSGFPKESLINITELSVTEFPKKMNTLKVHLETFNRGETLYFAINIMESYAFIYQDKELESFCKKIAEDSNTNNRDGLTKAFQEIDAITNQFTKELKELLEEIKEKEL
jgi:hypothetical protein